MRRKYGAQDILAATEEGLRYYPHGGNDNQPLFFHPSMAGVRLKRLMRGESDTMLTVAGVRPGDKVLDCTAGMASDAIVFAYAVGPQGRVVALESEPLVHLIASEGLARYPAEFPELDAAMRRVELLRADHLDFLRGLEAGSFDVVYFDPMFRCPVEDSGWLSPLRDAANGEPLRAEAVREAVRVARRCVVLKERSRSREFARLGFTPLDRKGSSTDYGVIRK
jgi:hypothetical protein